MGSAITLFAIIVCVLTAGWCVKRIAKSAGLIKLGGFIQGVALAALLLELLAAVLLRWYIGAWVYALPLNQNDKLFEPHPYLVGVNRKGVEERLGGFVFTHNTKGFRGEEWEVKSNDRVRIAAIGGSTTYGVGVNDWETWPYYLDSLLGDKAEVLNLGIPGHSTVEHIIFTALQLREIDPDVVIIHAGLNDLRNGHAPQLTLDYSNFHAPSLKSSLGLCPEEQLPRIAILRLVVRLMQTLHWYPDCNVAAEVMAGTVVSTPDERILNYYSHNLNTLVDLLHARQTKVVLVPQVLAKDAFQEGNYRWWAPFVADEAIFPFQRALNSVMKSVADKRCCGYPEVLDTIVWETTVFADPSHLNAQGNLEFAQHLSNWFSSSVATEIQGKDCATANER
jgi:lysophospholipase L1-like esterase